MERLIKIGQVKRKSSYDVKESPIGIGFEKLDRDVFDPEKAYDKVAAIGVKWVRIQSGWARTEKEKGVYDFEWLDKIVENLVCRNLRPWICLCYGNELYSSFAKKYFGAVGCPPIATAEEQEGWVAYVKAVVSRYRGKVQYYEIWNEPDARYSWKHNVAEGEPEPGPSAVEYAQFAMLTADAIHAADPEAKAVAFGVSHGYDFTYINTALAQGLADHMDVFSFHAYTPHDTRRAEYLRSYRLLLDSYRPGIEIIQGETGAQSRSDGAGAMAGYSWTPEKQRKHLLRNQLHDLAGGVKFTSYFSTMDMIEALRGIVGQVSTYLDYGYFGVLGADFDENGRSVGTYTPKPSYYALATLASVFAEGYRAEPILARRVVLPSKRIQREDCDDPTIVTYSFTKENGSKALVYWNAVPLLTHTYEGTVSFQTFGNIGKDAKLIDLADGSVYKLPEQMVTDAGCGEIDFVNLPITDSPLMLTFGDFCELE